MPIRSLRDGTITIIVDDDGTSSPSQASATVDLEDGDLAWTERRPVNIISDRGVLDHARLANEEPVELSFSMLYQDLQAHAAPTPYEILTQTGDAAAYVSQEATADVYAVKIQFVVTDPAGGASETLTFDKFAYEEISFSEGDPANTLSASGRAVLTAPAIS